MVPAQRLLPEPCVAAIFPGSRPPNTPRRGSSMLRICSDAWVIDPPEPAANAAIDPHLFAGGGVGELGEAFPDRGQAQQSAGRGDGRVGGRFGHPPGRVMTRSPGPRPRRRCGGAGHRPRRWAVDARRRAAHAVGGKRELDVVAGTTPPRTQHRRGAGAPMRSRPACLRAWTATTSALTRSGGQRRGDPGPHVLDGQVAVHRQHLDLRAVPALSPWPARAAAQKATRCERAFRRPGMMVEQRASPAGSLAVYCR